LQHHARPSLLDDNSGLIGEADLALDDAAVPAARQRLPTISTWTCVVWPMKSGALNFQLSRPSAPTIVSVNSMIRQIAPQG
jgi:hypothetical protein